MTSSNCGFVETGETVTRRRGTVGRSVAGGDVVVLITTLLRAKGLSALKGFSSEDSSCRITTRPGLWVGRRLRPSGFNGRRVRTRFGRGDPVGLSDPEDATLDPKRFGLEAPSSSSVVCSESSES